MRSDFSSNILLQLPRGNRRWEFLSDVPRPTLLELESWKFQNLEI